MGSISNKYSIIIILILSIICLKPAYVKGQTAKSEVQLESTKATGGLSLKGMQVGFAPASSEPTKPKELKVEESPEQRIRARELKKTARKKPEKIPETEKLRNAELYLTETGEGMYGVYRDLLYYLRPLQNGTLKDSVIARLPFISYAMCRHANGDLYIASQECRTGCALYRFDIRKNKLYKSNISIPDLDNGDYWISGTSINNTMYFLNKFGTALIEISPGKAFRNIMYDISLMNPAPAFIGKVMNVAALRSGDILLKENNTNKLWRIKNSNGIINCPNPIEINYEKATSSIAEDVSDVSEDKIYLSAVGGWDAPELIIYSLSSTENKQLLSFGLTDISIRENRKSKEIWSSTSELNGWFKGNLIKEGASIGQLGLLLSSAGEIDSISFNHETLFCKMFYKVHESQIQISDEPTFINYLAWHGYGFFEGEGSSLNLSLGLQSSFVDLLFKNFKYQSSSFLPYNSTTEVFADLYNNPKNEENPTDIVKRESFKPNFTSSILKVFECTEGEIIFSVSDYLKIDSDIVQFFINGNPISGSITLESTPKEIKFQCPSKVVNLEMRVISEGDDHPCTAKLVVTQGIQVISFKLTSELNLWDSIKIVPAQR